MASLLDENVPEFETIEDQLNFWIQKCYAIDERYQSLFCKHKQLLARTSDQSSQPPTKKPKGDNISTDPLEVLAEPIFHRIMGFLSAQELRDAMRVSNAWKKYIEKTNSLMTRATNGKINSVVRPDMSDTSFDGFLAFSDKNIEKRGFKHMEVPIWSESTSTVSLLPCYAQTLETLTVKPSPNDHESIWCRPLDVCEFPKLKSLTIDQCDLSCFQFCFFPICENLKIILRNGTSVWQNSIEFRLFLRNFPKLKNIAIVGGYSYRKTNSTDPDRIACDMYSKSKIQCAKVYSYYPVFLRDHGLWLQELSVKFINAEQLSWLLRDLKALKTLSVMKIEGHYRGEFFRDNTTIERFDVQLISPPHEPNNIIQPFMKALKSLSQLVFRFELTHQMITFIARNLKCLNNLTCAGATEDAMAVYRIIQNSDTCMYANTTFELSLQPELDPF